MSLHFQESPDGTIVIAGELDINHAQDAKAAMSRAVSAPGRTLDLSGITEIDYIGIQLLLAAHQHSRAARSELRVASRSDAVNEAFELLGMEAAFPGSLPRET